MHGVTINVVKMKRKQVACLPHIRMGAFIDAMSAAKSFFS